MTKGIDPLTCTPRQALAHNVHVCLYCRACSVLRPAAMERFTGSRADQPLAEMKFGCTTCGRLGRDSVATCVFLSWWDEGLDYSWDALERQLKVK